MHIEQKRFVKLAWVIGILLGSVCIAQPTVRNAGIPELLTQLHSADWAKRAEAYRQLRSDSGALATGQVRGELLILLDRENKVTETTLRDSNEQVGVSEKYGEEYSEYVSELGETVESFANWSDPRQVCIFVHEAYNPESRFASEIASHGKLAIPCLLQMYGSDVGLMRAEAAAVIVQALARPVEGVLDQATIRDAKQVVLNGLRDPSDAVRTDTIEALGAFGGQDMIPALRQVAERPGSGNTADAMKAIAAIEKRSGR